MNVKAIIIGLVALAVVGGGAAVVLTNKDDKPAETASSSQSASERTSLNDLLTQNKNVQCSFNSDEDNIKTAGTVYVAGQRMHGEFTIQQNGEAEQKSHVLRDDEYQYIWTEGLTDGIKIKNSATDEATAEAQQQTVDQDKDYDFSCEDWSVEEAKLTAPTDINFLDLSAQAEQLQNTDVDSAVCNQLTDEAARNACLSAY